MRLLFGRDVKEVDVDMIVKKRKELMADRGKRVRLTATLCVYFDKCTELLLLHCVYILMSCAVPLQTVEMSNLQEKLRWLMDIASQNSLG